MIWLAGNWRLALAALAVAGAALGGWVARGDHEAAEAFRAAQELQGKLAAEQLRGDGLALALEAEKQNIKTRTVTVVQRVPEVTTVYMEKPGDAPQTIPPAVFTRGFVGLWNDALAVGAAKPAGQPAGASAGADALVRARISQSDLLGNHAINAGRYAECRAQLNALIDWHEGRSASSP